MYEAKPLYKLHPSRHDKGEKWCLQAAFLGFDLLRYVRQIRAIAAKTGLSVDAPESIIQIKLLMHPKGSYK
jgi:hypothetical protein